MNKPFLTFKEQIERLDQKGISCSTPEERRILVRKGYFNLVNGYKKPFVSSTDLNGVHKYYPNTSVHLINKVFRFDRRISALLLKNITHVEEEIRNLVAYFFDFHNRKENTHWSDLSSYDSKVNQDVVKKLIATINDEIDAARDSKNPYITHYNQKSFPLPTWVMIKVIKMTTFSKFIEYSKIELRKDLCDLYQIEYKEANNDFKVLMSAINWIRKARNACAHNERIIFLSDDNPALITKYHKLLSNAYQKRNRSKQVVDLLIFLKYFNTTEDYKKLVKVIITELDQIKSVVESPVYEKIRVGLGIRQLEHIQLIVNEPKEIRYSKLI